ncbi:hypothetical protein LPJ66_009300 [Kickxella alabastrina]|uniref:Uncharacterized protein n=1 Tax=Kickxella alabastrina TaxID=61397 RepID=A0ACC1I660_9FUNG|nr:hypothetical protein LPJ66_009300 [Kickxella alabastrina]
MSSYSVFQTLPLLIIELVVKYYLAGDSGNRNTDTSVALSILHSCHLWRTILINRSFEDVYFNFQILANQSFTFPYWPICLGTPTFPTSHLVKTVHVRIGGWIPLMYMYKHSKFMKTPSSRPIYPAAHSLFVSVNNKGQYYDAMMLEGVDTLVDATAVFRAFRQMVPAVELVDISLSSKYDSTKATVFLGRLYTATEELYRGVKKLSFVQSSDDLTRTRVEPADVPGLTHFAYTCHVNTAPVVECIRRNAKTLVVLELNKWTDALAVEILINGMGDPVVYGCLEKIAFNMAEPLEESKAAEALTGSSAVVHFPWIRSAKVSGIFPYSDNVLFRGAGGISMLEEIDVWTDPRFVNMVDQHRAFTSAQFPHLQRIRLVNSFPPGHLLVRPRKAIVNHCVTQIIDAAGVSYTSLRSFVFTGDLSTGLLVKRNGESSGLPMFFAIRTLAVPGCQLELSDIVTILRCAPALHTLHCAAPICAPMIEGMEKEGIPDYMRAMGEEVGRGLRAMVVGVRQFCLVEYLAKTVALVGVAVAGRARFTLVGDDGPEFYAHISEIMQQEHFAEYADRIRAFARRNRHG